MPGSDGPPVSTRCPQRQGGVTQALSPARGGDAQSGPGPLEALLPIASWHVMATSNHAVPMSPALSPCPQPYLHVPTPVPVSPAQLFGLGEPGWGAAPGGQLWGWGSLGVTQPGLRAPFWGLSISIPSALGSPREGGTPRHQRPPGKGPGDSSQPRPHVDGTRACPSPRPLLHRAPRVPRAPSATQAPAA